MAPSTVLVTGCSEGGIGAGLAAGFAARGYRVLATLRDHRKAGSLAETPNVELLSLDVTQPESVKSLVSELETRLPDGKLDILVNNAGNGTTGPIIEADLAVMRQVYEVNVFGPLAVTQALLPLLIKAKGTVVNICSTAGLMPFLWRGVYHSSKASAHMLSETMRLELAPFGIKVLTGVIGGVRTEFFGNEIGLGLSEASRYKSVESEVFKRPWDDGTEPESIESFANHLIGDIARGATGAVYRGYGAQLIRLFGYHLPARLGDYVAKRMGGLNRLEIEKKAK